MQQYKKREKYCYKNTQPDTIFKANFVPIIKSSLIKIKINTKLYKCYQVISSLFHWIITKIVQFQCTHVCSICDHRFTILCCLVSIQSTDKSNTYIFKKFTNDVNSFNIVQRLTYNLCSPTYSYFFLILMFYIRISKDSNIYSATYQIR